MTIAVLMTCFNRVDTTLCCLQHLFACERPEGVALEVWLVDDASPDATGVKVKNAYPSVNIVLGTGKSYWCGGMRLAWNAAVQNREYDAFIWLNDDTFLTPDAIRILTSSAEKTSYDSIIVGAACDPVAKHATYGFTGNPPRDPDGSLSPIRRTETMNGNIVFIPRAVWLKIGGLRDCFTHGFGDTDYGVRALEAGIGIYLTPKFVGECQTNGAQSWTDGQLPFAQRWRLLHSPKGCPPRQFLRMVQVAHPFTWVKFVAKLYWRVVFPATRGKG